MKKIIKKTAFTSLIIGFFCISVSVASAEVSLEMHNNTTQDFEFKVYDNDSQFMIADYLVTASGVSTEPVEAPTRNYFIKACNNSNVCLEPKSCICQHAYCSAGLVVATVLTDRIGKIQLDCILPNPNG